MALSLKLVYFFVERAAEPVSQRLENAAQASPAFRAVCRRVATSFEHIEHQKAIRRLAFEQRAAELHGVHAEPGRAQGIPADEIESPPTLTESEAVQKGAELLGEFFVLGVGLGLLIHQQMRDRADEAENEAKVEKNESKIKTLEATNAGLQKRIESLERFMRDAEAQQSMAATKPASLRSLIMGPWRC